MNSSTTKKSLIVKTVALIGIMAALSSILRFLEFPLVFIAPGFLKFDLSNLPALIVSFVLGPFYGLIVVAVKNLVYLPATSTMGVGEIADFILGGIFVFSSGLIYKFKQTKKMALIGMSAGTIITALTAAFLNYFLLIPFFAELFHLSLDEIVGAFKKVVPFIRNLFDAVLFSVVPFNILKGVVISAVTFFVYKRISSVFKKIK